MDFDKYIENTLPDRDRTSTDTVIEFVKMYNRWAADCHNLVRTGRTQFDELTKNDSVARKVLQSIYNKYCTSKNRQYHRTHVGYFFYGGTYKSSYEITICTELTKNKVEIQTPKIKNIATSKKYMVVKQGQVWKIDTVESLEGNNKWMPDIL